MEKEESFKFSLKNRNPKKIETRLVFPTSKFLKEILIASKNVSISIVKVTKKMEKRLLKLTK